MLVYGRHSSDRVRSNLTSYYCLVPKPLRELLNKQIGCLQLQQTGKKSSRAEGNFFLRPLLPLLSRFQVRRKK